MKIAIATPVFYPMINGVAMFSYNLAKGLVSRGHEVLVLTPSQNKYRHTDMVDGIKVVYLSSTDVKVYPDQIHDVPKKKLFYKHGLKASIFPAGQIKRALSGFRPDVVHVQGSDPIGVATVSYAKKNKIPVVTTEHNQPEVLTQSLKMPGFTRKPVNNMLSSYFVKRQKKSDYVTMPTKLAIKKLIGTQNLGVPVEAVSNGVDLSAFKPGKPSAEIYKKYKIEQNVPIVLYIGRVDPEKKVGLVLRAFADFLYRCKSNKIDKLSKTLFVVVGDGVDKPRLMEEARSIGVADSVRFLGRVTGPDLAELYKLGDVFATASEIETQGIVLIEAAATGLPLIAVDAGAVAEVCKNTENGFLIKPGDVVAMSGALYRLLSDDALREKMSKKSIEIANEHSLDKTIDKFLEIYQKVCYNRKRL
ncbi:glycosyltransferase [Candidatus Saccharibacteria bacterium]|nr:glycosyltransferase [Candidatus Saccharibacteria bacterium]